MVNWPDEGTTWIYCDSINAMHQSTLGHSLRYIYMLQGNGFWILNCPKLEIEERPIVDLVIGKYFEEYFLGDWFIKRKASLTKAH